MSSAENKLAKQRPVGIAIIAALFAIYAVFLIVGLIIVFANPEKVQSRLTPANSEGFFLTQNVLDPLRMIFAATLSAGLWRLQNWARHGVAIFAMWRLADRIIVAAVLAPAIVPDALKSALSQSGIIRIFTFIVVLGYLYQPGVAKAFIAATE